MNEGFVFPRGFASKFQTYNSLNQVIPSGVWSAVAVDTIVYDLLNEVNLATFLFTPRQTGYYYIHAYAVWLGAVPVGTLCELRLEQTGLEIIRDRETADGINATLLQVSRCAYLPVGATIIMSVQQNSGVNQTLMSGFINQIFEGFRVA